MVSRDTFFTRDLTRDSGGKHSTDVYNNKRCQSVCKDKRKKDILQFTVKNVRGASFSDTP